MKLLRFMVLASILLSIQPIFGQAPTLGTAANFVLFSTDGSLIHTGISQLTGNVGTNNGSIAGFGNVNGVMHNADGASAQCAADLLIAYNQLNSTVPTFFIAPGMGNGDTLVAGVYSISAAATLDLDLYLDAQSDSNAVFIFQIQGSFSASALAKVKLLNGAMACNVFWKVEGLVSLGAAVTMRGTLIANNAAIELSMDDTLEGRALTTAGAITLDGVLAYTPVGCGSAVLTGPAAPPLDATDCFAIFSSVGSVTNAGLTEVNGDVGTNVGLTTGFDSLLVTGTIHAIPDTATANCAASLLVMYNYLSALPPDIELLFPAQFGGNLVLTPHTYLMNAAATFTDSLYLDARGNPDAVFVIQINGALSTSTYAKVLLIHGAQAKNVWWVTEGAVEINDFSIFCGTIVANNSSIGIINSGVILDGKAFTTSGALNTSAMSATSTAIAPGCGNLVGITSAASQPKVTLYPNPAPASTNIRIAVSDAPMGTELWLYNGWGALQSRTLIVATVTTVETQLLPSGIYYYQLTSPVGLLKAGKLVTLK